MSSSGFSGGQLSADTALTDCAFLVRAQPSEVLPLLDRATNPEARLAAAVYRTSLWRHRDVGPAVRRQVLGVDAARRGAKELAARFAAVPVAGEPDPAWSADWATGYQIDDRRLFWFRDDATYTNAVACTELAGRTVAVTGGYEGLIRVWDLATGELIGNPLPGDEDPVQAVLSADLDGRPAVVTVGLRGHVSVWDLTGGEPVALRSCYFDDVDGGMACANLGGRQVLVIGGPNGVVRVWDLTTGEPVGRRLSGHSSFNGVSVAGVACTTLGGRSVAVTVGHEMLVRDLATGEQIGQPLIHDNEMSAVACTTLAGRPVAVIGCIDGTVLVWDLASGALVGKPLGGRTGGVRAMTCADLDGRQVAIVGQMDTVRLWDLAGGELVGRPIGKPLLGFGDAAALAHAVVDGRPVVVTCSDEGMVGVWRLTAPEPVGRPLVGHSGSVSAVVCAEFDGRVLVVSGGSDDIDDPNDIEEPNDMVRVWDLAGGEPAGRVLARHTDFVAALACTQLHGQTVAVGGVGKTVLVWDLVSGALVGRPMIHTTEPGRVWVEAVVCAELDGRPLAVSVSGGRIRVWDLARSEPIGASAPGGSDRVYAVACTVLDGRPVVVSGCMAPHDDAPVRVWDLASGEPIGRPMIGHTDDVRAVACTELHGRPVAVTGSDDRTVRVWDLISGEPMGKPMIGHTGHVRVVACTELDGRPVAVTGSTDRTVRVWDLVSTEQIGPELAFPGYVTQVAAPPGGRLVIAFGADLAVLSRTG